jgi:MFS family permease
MDVLMSNKNDIGTRSSLRWMVLITVIVGTLLGRLDSTVVNLALPKIINDFSITVSEASWIVTAYILANSVFVPIWGKLGDTIRRKKVYLSGFTIFIVGSILTGLAWNLSSMLVSRAIQAVARSADYPTAMAIIAVTFPDPNERTQALGLWSSSFVGASVLGPLIGGPLIDTFGWRSVFFKGSGPISALPVQEGASVKKGDALATLNSTELQLGVQQAQAALAGAQTASTRRKHPDATLILLQPKQRSRPRKRTMTRFAPVLP